MKKSSVLGGLAFAAILGSVFTFPAYAKEKTFPEGIYAGGFALGGLTKEQAETQFAAYISGLEERSVTLDVAGNGLETTAKDLGYACKNEDALQEAEEYAAGGCLIRQYMERKDLEKEPVHISLDAGVDETAVQTFVEEQCSGLPGEPQDAVITRVNGKFEITPEQSGMAVDVKATTNYIRACIPGSMTTTSLRLPTMCGDWKPLAPGFTPSWIITMKTALPAS